MSAAHIFRLHGAIQPYAWGSRSAIAELQGRPPTSEPEAELWLGAHPQAPARLQGPEGEVPLDAWIARNPEQALGASVARRFGALPFLLKVLAAEQPLSIQAHPDAQQARAGFDRENAQGLDLQSAERSYRDPRAKPELICALSPFVALNRFRDPRAILSMLEPLALAELEPGLIALERSPEPEGLETLLLTLLGLARDAQRRVVARAAGFAAEHADQRESRWVSRLAALHPEDAGVLAPWILNLVELAPGEAMFLGAGELHAYLEGVGIECMASSDNVLRGGLTRKFIDTQELLRVLRFTHGDVQVLSARRIDAVESRYETPAREFALSRLEVSPGLDFVSPGERGPEILLVTSGEGVVESGETHFALRAGESVFIPAGAPPYRLRGQLVVSRAVVGAF